MWNTFRKKNKQKANLLPAIERDFDSYTGKRIPYKSEEYWEIMNRKCLFSIKGFRSHPSLFDVMIRNDTLYYIGLNHGMVRVG